MMYSVQALHCRRSFEHCCTVSIYATVAPVCACCKRPSSHFASVIRLSLRCSLTSSKSMHVRRAAASVTAARSRT